MRMKKILLGNIAWKKKMDLKNDEKFLKSVKMSNIKLL